MFTIHHQIEVMNSILNGAFKECMYVLLTYVVYSFYSHVLSLHKPSRKPIDPSTVGAHIHVDPTLAKAVLTDIINHTKELEEMKMLPVKKLSAVAKPVEPVKATTVYVSPNPVLPEDLAATLYTIRDLKKLASQQKVKGYSNMTKSQLLEFVQLPN